MNFYEWIIENIKADELEFNCPTFMYFDPKKEKEVFSTLYANYANVVQEFLDKNKQLLNELSSKNQKGGE